MATAFHDLPAIQDFPGYDSEALAMKMKVAGFMCHPPSW